MKGPTTYFADPLEGPFVLPGQYRVTLMVNGVERGIDVCSRQQRFA